MARIEVSPAANADLAEIAVYLRRHVGDRVVNQLEAHLATTFRRLADHPESGSTRPALGRGIRMVTVKPYVVLHRYNRADDMISIVRVLHGRRRLSLDAT